MKNRTEICENRVKKYYHSVIACDNEKYILGKLQGNGISPEVYTSDEKMLETEFISAKTLAGLIDSCKNLQYAFEKLVDFMMEFNRITETVVLDDINLKNFIFSENKIYGIDFEKWHSGDNMLNLAAIPALIKNAKFEDENTRAALYNHIKEYILKSARCDRVQLGTLTQQYAEKTLHRRKAMKKIRQSDCVIIAGGKSSRMGSPKGLLEYKGRTFIDHIIYNTAVFDRQYISANDDMYNKFGLRLIEDKVRDAGPMGAVFSALETCESEYVFFIPCDMPFITEETVVYLFSKMDSNADAVIYTAENRVFPTVGIYKKSALPQVITQIESGNYRMMELLDRIKTQYVSAPLPRQFKNINTPDDYKNIK